jgi:penicillin-binding protein-related factor A (putative recombinase)
MDTGEMLERKLQSWLKDIRCYSYKPADFKSFGYLLVNYPQLQQRMPKVPCDRIIIYKGRSYFFELKHTIGKSINFNRFKDHQLGALTNHKNKGKGQSYIIMGFRIDSKLRIFLVDIDYVTNFIYKSKRKSIPISWCIDNGTEINSKNELERFLEDGST